MKGFFIIITFLATILLLSFVVTTNPVSITGHIKFRDSSMHIRRLLVVVRGNNKILATTNTNSNGDFYLSFTPKNERSFKFYCSAPAIGTKFIGSVKEFESDTPEMTFYIPVRSKAK